MGKRSIRRKIEQVYENLPPLPPTLEELPIEQWTREFMEVHGPSPYARYDQDFWRWLEQFPGHLGRELRRHIDEAWSTLGVKELSPETATRIGERAEKVLPPYIDRCWQQFQAGKAERDEWAVGVAEVCAELGGTRPHYFPNTETPEEIRRRANKFEAEGLTESLVGGWRLDYHRERAELAERYEHWPEEWRQFYATWRKENEA
jgi:hypothetical protein